MRFTLLVPLLLVGVVGAERITCGNETILGNKRLLFCEKRNATSAGKACKLFFDGSLITIKSKDEQRHVEEIIGKLDGCLAIGGASTNLTYIGLSDARKEGVWRWSDGTRQANTSYSNWKTAAERCNQQPNGGRQCEHKVDQDYVAIQRCNGGFYGQWFDITGDQDLSFICDITNATDKNRLSQRHATRVLERDSAGVERYANEYEYPLNNRDRSPKITAATQATTLTPPSPATSQEANTATTSKNVVQGKVTSVITDQNTHPSAEANTAVTAEASIATTTKNVVQGKVTSVITNQNTHSNAPKRGEEHYNFLTSTNKPFSPRLAPTQGAENENSKRKSTVIPTDKSWSERTPLRDDDELVTEKEKSTKKPIMPEARPYPRNDPRNGSSTTLSRSGDERDEVITNELECLMSALETPPRNSGSTRRCPTRLLPTGPLKNPVEHFETNIAATAATIMINAGKNHTISAGIQGIEMKLTPVKKGAGFLSRKERFLTLQFGEQNCKDCDTVEIRKDHLEELEGDVVVVSAALKRDVLEGTGVYSLLTAEQDAANSQTSYDSESHVDKFTSVMSVSIYKRIRGGELRKVNMPATTIFDIRNDTSEARLIASNPRRIVTGVKRECVFMDRNAKWSKYGCEMTDEGAGSLRCECNHTTAFAIMVSLTSFEIPVLQERILLLIELVGVFFLCLTLCLLVWLRRNLKKDRVLTQINLTMALLLMHISMLIATHVVSVEGACITLTFFSHYFMIASSLWMLNEGFVLYKKTCSKALNFDMNKLKRWLLVIGWVMPAVYVIICVGIGVGLEKYIDLTEGYKTALKRRPNEVHNITKYERCWLGIEYKMILAGLVPVAISMCVVVYFLIRVSRVVWVMNVHSQNMRPSDASDKDGAIKSTVRAVALLVPVLGVPWIFAFMVNIPGAELVFVMIHGIANGLQGVVFFIIYIVASKEVRKITSRRLTRSSGGRSFSISVSMGTTNFKRAKSSTLSTIQKESSTVTPSPTNSPTREKRIKDHQTT